MLKPSMASSPPTSIIFQEHERLDLESIRVLVDSVNKHIDEFLFDSGTRESQKLRCLSRLKMPKQEFFEFSEYSVLSNLYWGIESIEAAVQAKRVEERASKLSNAEQILQVPALLDEHEFTAGIANEYLVCCSYFYLALVRKLQCDEWQVALHLLQALLVCPSVVRTEFLPGFCEGFFVSQLVSGEDEVSEAIRQKARRYKDWLMYYQVISYGETKSKLGCREIASPGGDSITYGKFSSKEYSYSIEGGKSWPIYHNFEKVHPLDHEETITKEMTDEANISSNFLEQKTNPFQDRQESLTNLDHHHKGNITRTSTIKSVQEVLQESQSDTPISSCDDSADDGESEAYTDDSEISMTPMRANADDREPEICEENPQASCSTLKPEYRGKSSQREVTITKFVSSRFPNSISDLNLSITELRENNSHSFRNFHDKVTNQRKLQLHDFKFHNRLSITATQRYGFAQMGRKGRSARRKLYSSYRKMLEEKDSHSELAGILQKEISKLCFSEGLRKCNEDYTIQVTMIYEILINKAGTEYGPLKDVVLDQLLTAISTSKEEEVIRASVSILSTIISGNKMVIEDIKQKGLQLGDLARALKKNVHEAAILIYLINPSPVEMKTLELLPTLVEVVCASSSYNGDVASRTLTPPVASLMIIEVLVTAFDYATNNTHLAAISSPEIISGLLEVARKDTLEVLISLATILVKCMRFDGQCRKYISQFTPVASFVRLLRSYDERAKFIALELFHEVLRMPRSSAINLLKQIRNEGSINIMHMLMPCLQKSQPECQVLAANLLLQLDMLEEKCDKSIFREEAMEVLLEAVASVESSTSQLAAFILSNLGGTYAWTGEPYTVAWLVKRAGLTSSCHRNMIRNFDWLDQSLQDTGTEAWCSKVAGSIIKLGNPLFQALEKGLKSKIRRVSRDCLTAIAWLGCEIAKSPDSLRYAACEILLSEIQQFLHPGYELEERLLACLCVYIYASGKGMQKLINFSEGVRESLRRLSSMTWMAEELVKVADYFLPNKSRISCVHTQILEAGHNCGGAVTALIYYKGQLCSGYSDGSLKVWEIKGQSATLVWDVKEHKKAVTCFSLFEPGASLLSGSSDKTIRVWRIVHRKLECIEMISTKDPVRQLETFGELIFVATQSSGVKVFDASRKVKDICKSKHPKCIKVAQGKIYIGCTDSSIQELCITSKREREIKAPAKSWRMQGRPINSILAFRDWLYSASTVVEGSPLKELKRHGEPQISIVTTKGVNVLAMGVVEDFMYLNCSTSASILQIWLRGTQQKVGRLSAGSKITTLLTANDIVLCGTETGLIKGWIPL